MHASDFFLRTAVALSQAFHGNLLTGVVFLAISRANVSHLPRSHYDGDHDEAGVFPDRMRRATSVLSVANSLGLSYETTRRHVAQLVEAGYCVRAGGKGVVAPAAAIRRPEVDELVAQTYIGARALVRTLRLAEDRPSPS